MISQVPSQLLDVKFHSAPILDSALVQWQGARSQGEEGQR